MTKAKIYYHDIGDYLSREEKLSIVKKFGSMANMEWKELTPNEHGDWIAMRNESFDTFIPMAPEKKFDLLTKTFFNTYSNGMVTSRDAWIYNFSKKYLKSKIAEMISYYENERQRTNDIDLLNNDLQKISWSVNLKNDLKRNISHQVNFDKIIESCYRPFSKVNVYFDRKFIERPGFNDSFFPSRKSNLAIGITGIGASKDFSVIITDSAFDFQTLMNGLIFPLYFYEENTSAQKGLFDENNGDDYIRRDGVSDFILERAQKQYGVSTGSTSALTKEDIFYYVYGFLHSPTYRETFANDLKKMLPRLPLVDDVRDFWAFSKAGRKLAELHLNYENQGAAFGVQVTGDTPNPNPKNPNSQPLNPNSQPLNPINHDKNEILQGADSLARGNESSRDDIYNNEAIPERRTIWTDESNSESGSLSSSEHSGRIWKEIDKGISPIPSDCERFIDRTGNTHLDSAENTIYENSGIGEDSNAIGESWENIDRSEEIPNPNPLIPNSLTPNPTPQTPNPTPQIPNPTSQIPNPTSQIPNPTSHTLYKVEKMRFPKKDQKDTIIYNSRITISNIPAEAYEYVVNGKSAIEWIMERYQITTHKDSGITNDPNDWAEEVGNPRYILDLLLSIINVSVQSVEIVKGLPGVRFE